MRVIIIGPQGSGKSTQGKIISERYDLCYISSGDLAREIASQDTTDGKRFKASLDKGEMVDDVILARYIKQKIASSECQNGYILDGYPRRLSQIEAYEPDIDKVFYVWISDEESFSRLLSRDREDDTSELIKKRLQVYHLETEPVLGYYQRLGKLIRVNGDGTIKQVTGRIINALQPSLHV